MTTIGGTGSAHHPLCALWVHELQHARAHRPLQAQWVSEMTTVGGTGSAHHPVPALRVSELSHARARHPVRTGAALLRQRGRLCRLAAACPRVHAARMRSCVIEPAALKKCRQRSRGDRHQFSPAPTYASPPSSESESLTSSPSGFSSTGCPYPSTAKHASVSAAITATTGAPSGCRDRRAMGGRDGRGDGRAGDGRAMGAAPTPCFAAA